MSSEHVATLAILGALTLWVLVLCREAVMCRPRLSARPGPAMHDDVAPNNESDLGPADDDSPLLPLM
jgi:hypothetical protein